MGLLQLSYESIYMCKIEHFILVKYLITISYFYIAYSLLSFMFLYIFQLENVSHYVVSISLYRSLPLDGKPLSLLPVTYSSL